MERGEKRHNPLNGLLFSMDGDPSVTGFIGNYLGAGFYLVGFRNGPNPNDHEARVVFAGDMEYWDFFETEDQMNERMSERMKEEKRK
jgi:hypothetical protein